jgi:hypothetical protein
VLFKTHATPVREQLLYTTAFSTLYSLGATVASGQLLHAVTFLGRHPDAAAAVVTLSLASTVIQVGGGIGGAGMVVVRVLKGWGEKSVRQRAVVVQAVAPGALEMSASR